MRRDWRNQQTQRLNWTVDLPEKKKQEKRQLRGVHLGSEEISSTDLGNYFFKGNQI